MKYADIASFVEKCSSHESQIRWCDVERFDGENMPGASPGGNINPHGYFVIGTTIGGNAIVIGDHDGRVCFADHTWYSGDQISFQDLAGDRDWHDVDFTTESVAKSLFPLSQTKEEFLNALASGKIDEVIDEID